MLSDLPDNYEKTILVITVVDNYKDTIGLRRDVSVHISKKKKCFHGNGKIEHEKTLSIRSAKMNT